MIRFLLTAILFSFCLAGFSQETDIAEIKKLNKEWLQSYPKKDSATLKRIFADDFVLVSPKGVKMTKNDIVNNLANQETRSINIENEEVKMLSADVGLITVYSNFILIVDGKEVNGRNCYQDVYVKRNGRWYAVAAHVTLLSLQ